ncbi:hypothetical protein BU14_0354s0004 [Porphyra umbilicalis]|uniref:Uncharacterized protein n=1 Tax=Porphyra umbilicalis TaxID=2786 RepID=A0A1X6NXT6_PORUM|nr:hypothetical protein BU14_0354s0004 [Porphyra umbilicalis]|eukprot:OSX73355.1 hypothetical protein BU14_0354s0004 [Porphyra umbilicalis]
MDGAAGVAPVHDGEAATAALEASAATPMHGAAAPAAPRHVFPCDGCDAAPPTGGDVRAGASREAHAGKGDALATSAAATAAASGVTYASRHNAGATVRVAGRPPSAPTTAAPGVVGDLRVAVPGGPTRGARETARAAAAAVPRVFPPGAGIGADVPWAVDAPPPGADVPPLCVATDGGGAARFALPAEACVRPRVPPASRRRRAGQPAAAGALPPPRSAPQAQTAASLMPGQARDTVFGRTAPTCLVAPFAGHVAEFARVGETVIPARAKCGRDMRGERTVPPVRADSDVGTDDTAVASVGGRALAPPPPPPDPKAGAAPVVAGMLAGAAARPRRAAGGGAAGGGHHDLPAQRAAAAGAACPSAVLAAGVGGIPQPTPAPAAISLSSAASGVAQAVTLPRRSGGGDDRPWTVVPRRGRRRGARPSPAASPPAVAPPAENAPPLAALPAAARPPSPPGPPVSAAMAVVPSAADPPLARAAVPPVPPPHPPMGASAAVVVARSAAAVAALTMPTRAARRRPAPPTLLTLHVSGVSRAERTRSLRGLVAAAAAVRPAAIVDVDRFGSTAAVTLVAAAAEAFRAGLADPRAASTLRVVAAAAPWSPAFLGGRRRAQLAAPGAAAIEAAERCLGRLDAKQVQVAARVGMPPPLRAALADHVAAQRAACARALATLRAVPSAPPTPADWAPPRGGTAPTVADPATPPDPHRRGSVRGRPTHGGCPARRRRAQAAAPRATRGRL